MNQKDDLPLGTRVRTRKPTRESDDWTESAKASRRWGVTGTAVERHDSPGVSYDVRHDDGSMGAYESRELERLDDENPLEMVRRIVSAHDWSQITEDEAVQRILSVLVAPFVARAASGEENGMGAPYCGHDPPPTKRAIVEVSASNVWFSPCEPSARKEDA